MRVMGSEMRMKVENEMGTFRKGHVGLHRG